MPSGGATDGENRVGVPRGVARGTRMGWMGPLEGKSCEGGRSVVAGWLKKKRWAGHGFRWCCHISFS